MLTSRSRLQVLLAVDYSVHLFHGREHIQKYLLTFMNIVSPNVNRKAIGKPGQSVNKDWLTWLVVGFQHNNITVSKVQKREFTRGLGWNLQSSHPFWQLNQSEADINARWVNIWKENSISQSVPVLIVILKTKTKKGRWVFNKCSKEIQRKQR